jgi:murein DD-endopeptidase MepM/ murein hydrolase activator NlpD
VARHEPGTTTRRPWLLRLTLIPVVALSFGALIVAPLPAQLSTGPLATAAAAPPFTLALPLPWGSTAKVNGPHGWAGETGTRSSVDVFIAGGATFPVGAAAAGTAHVESGCVVRIDHADGWATKYMHLKNIDTSINNQPVAVGRRLGDAGSPDETCGRGTGRHVHLALFRNGVEQPIAGTSIGGYTVHNGADYYCGWWSRDSDGASLGYNDCAEGLATLSLPNNQSTGGGAVTPPADADGDGVPDATDQCPTQIGSTVFLGCQPEELEQNVTSRSDFNGDGRGDYCRLVGTTNNTSSYLACTVSTGTGFGATYLSGVADWGQDTGRAWVDFNGDGRTDYCRIVGTTNFASSYAACTPSTGTGFGTTILSGVLDWGFVTGRAWVDANGDGRADYCRRVGAVNNTSSYVSCTLSAGSSFGATTLSDVLDWGFETGRTWADFNGDGTADFCRLVGTINLATSYAACTLSTTTGFGATYLSGVLDWGLPTGRAWPDVNADGRADFCRRVGTVNNTSSYVSCTVSTGTGFGATALSGVLDWGFETGRAWTDVTGDGRADYCRLVGTTNFASSYAACTPSTGTGFAGTYLSGIIDWGFETGRGWTDANRDGRADYCRRVGAVNNTSSFVSCTFSTGTGFGTSSISGVVDWGLETGRAWTGTARRPDAPARPTARPGNTRATLMWTGPASTGRPAVSSYMVTAAPGGRTCTTTVRTCTVAGLKNGTSYRFTVRAVNSVGSSPSSAASEPVVPVTTPSVVRSLAAKPGSGKTKLTWVAPATTGGRAILRYQYRVRAKSSTTWSTWVSSGLTRAKTIKALRHGRVYLVQVRAVSSVGAGPAAGARVRIR